MVFEGPLAINYRGSTSLCNNQISARALIGQLAMVYFAGKHMEKSRAFCIFI